MPPLSQASTTVILLSTATTLLLLRNNQIPLHQFLNFVLSPSNYPKSGTMLFGVIVYMFLLYTASTGAVNISFVSGIASSVLLFNMLSLVILSDPNISFNTSIVSGLCPAILSVHGLYYNCFVSDVCSCPWSAATIVCILLELFFIFFS